LARLLTFLEIFPLDTSSSMASILWYFEDALMFQDPMQRRPGRVSPGRRPAVGEGGRDRSSLQRSSALFRNLRRGRGSKT
jgi:hypothetical protein